VAASWLAKFKFCWLVRVIASTANFLFKFKFCWL